MAYLVQCWNCLGEFDAVEAVWCGDSSTHPTKICPFCLQCFCAASTAYKDHFWESAPEALRYEIKTLNESKQRIGDLLVREKRITHEELLRALETQKRTGQRLGEVLVAAGRLKPGVLDELLRRQQTVITADLSRAVLRPELIRQVGVDLCYERRILPLSRDEVGDRPHVTLAMADPSDGRTVDEVQARMGARVIAEAASEAEILDLLRNLFPRAADASALEETPEEVKAQLVELVRAAVRRRASHIQIESRQTELWVFFRIDGVLYRVRRLPKRILHLLLSELRVFVKHPEGTPFDHGRTFLRIGERAWAILVMVRDGEQGENVLVRLVDVDRYGRSLEETLGDPRAAARVREALVQRRGLVVLTSPLFHGRREALYAAIRALRDAGRPPLSLETAVAAPIRGIRQEEVDSAEAARRLRGLRDAPPPALALSDVLRAANVRDVLGVAENALVVASVRAHSVSHALLTMLEWGVSGLELSEYLVLVSNQRQVRRLCPSCRVPDDRARGTVYLGLTAEEVAALGPMRSTGCTACQRLGSLGRVTLCEVLSTDSALRSLIASEPAPEAIYAAAVERGMVPLRESFLEKVREGTIALEEFEKVAV